MEVKRLTLADIEAAGGPAGAVRRLRYAMPTPDIVVNRVRTIVGDVKERGDEAVLRFTRELDTDGAPRPLIVPPQELDLALGELPMDVVAGLQVAISNLAEVAQAGVGHDIAVDLPQGQQVTLRELPVGSAAVYVPGGRAPYPSTAVMGVVAARAAGVLEVVVCSPPAPDGQVHPVILGACRLLGVERVYRMGGAQAIAALAFGTATIEPVDVIVGPGNLYVQEAKREVAGIVGIDGFAGPSDLMVLLDVDTDRSVLEMVALDLLAQAEHGSASVVLAVSPAMDVLNALEDLLWSRLRNDPVPVQADRGSALYVPVEVKDARMAIDFANAFAPEHLQLVGAEVEKLAPKVRNAGCLLIGRASATAFSDYVAGSNHILPTAGAARFSSGLSAAQFRRRMSVVRIDPDGASKLARAGAPIARAEGFEWHARSMEARAANEGAIPGDA